MADADQQTALLKLSDNLLYNFPALIEKSDLGVQIVKDVLDFYKKKAELEQDYSKKLSSFHKTKIGSGLFTKDPAIAKEYRTLQTAINSVNEVGLKLADQQMDFGTKILNEICKPLEAWIKGKDSERKKIIGEGQKHLRVLQDARAAVTKAKEACDKHSKEVELAKDAMAQAEKAEINEPDNKSLMQNTRKASHRLNQANDKAKALDEAYKASIQKANDELKAYQTEKMPQVIESLQKVEEDRWNLLLNSVKILKSLESDLPNGYNSQVLFLEEAIKSASIEQDFMEYVEINKKDEETPIVPQ